MRWRRVRSLLREAAESTFYFSAATIGILIGSYLLPIDSSGTRPLRVAGCVFQILGALTVAVGIASRRQMFDRPSLLVRFWRALTGPPTVSIGAGTILASASVEAHTTVINNPPQDATIEQRIGSIERNIDLIREDIVGVRTHASKKVGEVKQALDKERADRSQAVSEVKRQIEEVQVGGIYVDTVGLAWLLFGIVLTSVPDEIALGSPITLHGIEAMTRASRRIARVSDCSTLWNRRHNPRRQIHTAAETTAEPIGRTIGLFLSQRLSSHCAGARWSRDRTRHASWACTSYHVHPLLQPNIDAALQRRRIELLSLRRLGHRR